MSKYERLNYGERHRIAVYSEEHTSVSEIARRLQRSKSTISRELRRMTGLYIPGLAEYDATKRGLSRRSPQKLGTNSALRREVFKGLRKRWSPDQISNYLKKEFPDDSKMRVSHETIYTYLYALPRGALRKELISYLRQEKKTRRRRIGSLEKRGKLPEMISIDERPKAVEKRSIPGHWEGDLIIGKDHASAIGTLVERKTRVVLLVPMKNRRPSDVRKAFERALKTLPEQMKRTMTYDQGIEMAEHRLFTKRTNMKVYFCHPSSPWERGTCENTNGLIRQYFPKSTDLSKITRARLRSVQNEINDRPRKTLNYRTPKEVFNKEILKSLR